MSTEQQRRYRLSIDFTAQPALFDFVELLKRADFLPRDAEARRLRPASQPFSARLTPFSSVGFAAHITHVFERRLRRRNPVVGRRHAGARRQARDDGRKGGEAPLRAKEYRFYPARGW